MNNELILTSQQQELVRQVIQKQAQGYKAEIQNLWMEVQEREEIIATQDKTIAFQKNALLTLAVLFIGLGIYVLTTIGG